MKMLLKVYLLSSAVYANINLWKQFALKNDLLARRPEHVRKELRKIKKEEIDIKLKLMLITIEAKVASIIGINSDNETFDSFILPAFNFNMIFVHKRHNSLEQRRICT